MEPLGIVVFSCIMGTAGFSVILEAVRQLLNHTRTELPYEGAVIGEYLPHMLTGQGADAVVTATAVRLPQNDFAQQAGAYGTSPCVTPCCAISKMGAPISCDGIGCQHSTDGAQRTGW